MKLNSEYINIYIIDNLIYYKVVEVNKKDKYYMKIHNAIAEGKDKFREITLNKYFAQDEVLYYKNRL